MGHEAIRKEKSNSNRTDLFNDSTDDNFISGVTIGLFNFKDSETQSGAVACRLEPKNNWFWR